MPCDYWIVSSRKCHRRDAKCGGTCCLRYYHRTSDRYMLEADQGAFLGSLDPNRPVVFVIHGSYNRWGDVVSESRHIHRWMHSVATPQPFQVVFFTWPSDGNMPFVFPVDIGLLGCRSSFHAFYLAQLVCQLPPQQSVCFIGHSHGARTAAGVLHLIGGGCLEKGQYLPPGLCSARRLRAVLIAAALDHDWLNPGDRFGQALCPAERVLIMRNSDDFTLALYPLRKPFSARSLGRKGLDDCDRMSMNGLNAKVSELDVACFIRGHHGWSNYYQYPELASAMLPYMTFQDEAPLMSYPMSNPDRNQTPLMTPGAPPALSPALNNPPAFSPPAPNTGMTRTPARIIPPEFNSTPTVPRTPVNLPPMSFSTPETQPTAATQQLVLPQVMWRSSRSVPKSN